MSDATDTLLKRALWRMSFEKQPAFDNPGDCRWRLASSAVRLIAAEVAGHSLPPADADRMAEAETIEACAKLVEDMIGRRGLDRPDARMALAIAANTIRRGRHLSESEQLNNLAEAIGEDDPELAERIRKAAAHG